MMRPPIVDRDYLVARLHARRSRIVEGARLEVACQAPTLAELGRTLTFSPARTTRLFERDLLARLLDELTGVLAHLEPNARPLAGTVLTRFQLENIKILLRAHQHHLPPAEVRNQLLPLPLAYALQLPALTTAASVREFLNALPPGRVRDAALTTMSDRAPPPPPFLLETALESGYREELLHTVTRLPPHDQVPVAALHRQEVFSSQFLTVIRGRFQFHLPPDALQRALLPHGNQPSRWLRTLLAAPDPATAVALGRTAVLDERPAAAGALDLAQLEGAVWRRFIRLARDAFRRSHMGLGAVAGYFALRRMEVANLITVSEGIRLGVDPSGIVARLITPARPEAGHV